MRTITRLFGAMLLCGWACFAQSIEAPKEPIKSYRLDFVVKEMEAGKTATVRNYSMMVSTDGLTAEIRAGSKVPNGASYLDIGTNIDCKTVVEQGNELSLILKVEVVSLVQDTDPHPVMRQNSWQSRVVIPLKKPIILFSSDDNTTKRTLQFEVTATPRS